MIVVHTFASPTAASFVESFKRAAKMTFTTYVNIAKPLIRMEGNACLIKSLNIAQLVGGMLLGLKWSWCLSSLSSSKNGFSST